jgi:lysophospholipase L1-like esterase
MKKILIVLVLLSLTINVHADTNISLYSKIDNQETLNMLVIGDSIGLGSGASSMDTKWYIKLIRQLRLISQPESTSKNISVSGYTAFEGLYDFNNFVKSDSTVYDLVILSFGRNDQRLNDVKAFRAYYENLVTKINGAYPDSEIILIIENSQTVEEFATEIINIGNHYNLPYIDMRQAFADSEVSDLTTDGVHPNDAGQQIYYEQIYNAILNPTRQTKTIPTTYQNPYTYKFDNLQIYKTIDSKQGFTDTVYKNNLIYIYDNVLGNYREYKFIGSIVGIMVYNDSSSGIANVYIDGVLTKQVDLYYSGNRQKIFLITHALVPGEHTIRVEVSGEKNPNSEDYKIMMHGLIIN